MRKPSEYVPAALANLRRRSMSDCVETLRHGEASAEVVRVGSPARGEDAASDLRVLEHCRVLAFAADFPDITRGSTVVFRGSTRYVTAVKTNPTAKTLVVGLSVELEPVVWRRDAYPHTTGTFMAALHDGGPSQNAGNVYSPVVADAWTAFIAFDAAEAERIVPGDTLTREDGTSLSVQQVRRDDPGGWILRLASDMKGPLQ